MSALSGGLLLPYSLGETQAPVDCTPVSVLALCPLAIITILEEGTVLSILDEGMG